MFGFNNKAKKQEQLKRDIEMLANVNLFSFLGADLPIINDDANQYINRIWRSVGVVYTATSLIYEKVLQCPVVFYKVKDKKANRKLKAFKGSDVNTDAYRILKARALEEVEPIQALQDLLKQPNPQQRWSDFLGVFCLSYLLTGNSYVYKQLSKTTKRPIELWAMPELHIESGGTYNPVKSYYQFWQTENEKQYPADTIYHARTPNPNFTTTGSQLYGVSPLRAFLEPLRSIEESYKQASKQLKSGGVLAMLSPARAEDAFNAEQRTAFMNKFKEALLSQSPNSRYLTSSIAMDVQQVGLPSGDLDLLNIRSADEQAVYKAYKIPLQFYNQDSSSYNNQSIANIQFITNAVSPIAKVVSDMLTDFVGIHFDDTIIELDVNSLPEMSANIKEQMEWIVKGVDNGILKPNEGRYQIGYGEVDEDYMNSFWYKGRPLGKLFDADVNNINNNNNGAS